MPGSPRHDAERLRRVGPPALRPGVDLRRPGLPALDPGCSGRPSRTAHPPHTTGSQTAPAWSRSFVQWGAPPGPGGRGPAGRSLRDGKPQPTTNTLVKSTLGETGETILLRTTLSINARPTVTAGTTRTYRHRPTSEAEVDLVRDEEVVGSNPATPTSSEAPSRFLTGPLRVNLRVYAASGRSPDASSDLKILSMVRAPSSNTGRSWWR